LDRLHNLNATDPLSDYAMPVGSCWQSRAARFTAIVALSAITACGSRSQPEPVKAAAGNASPVVVEPVRMGDVDETLDAIGAAQPWLSATIRAQIAGRLVAVPVGEGAVVRRGQLLAQLDAAPYEAAVAQAQGVLERDRAAAQNARLTSSRYETLLSSGMIDRATVDTQSAAVRQSESQIRVDEAAVQAARVNLGYTRIVAPFDGRLGLRFSDPGNLVGPGDANGILVLNQLSPLAVIFAIPQAQLQRVIDASKRFSAPLAVEAVSQEAGAVLATGRLLIADNRIDPSTGTVQLKARFDNADQRLWPGQMLNVRVRLGIEKGVKIVPNGALANGPDGAFVYVLRNDKAVMTPVKVTLTNGGVSVIEGDVRADEPIVVDGQLNLKPGASVRVVRGGGPPSK
jgi:multidrug efflux system membrane fusion protein